MKVTPGNPQWLEWVEGWAAEANDKSAQAYAKVGCARVSGGVA
jgi:hypothetical protein